MRIQSVEYLQCANGLKDAPDFGGMPEWVLVGRSNVGKSSFINAMTGRKNIARTSNTPGKTRMIHYYRINQAFLFVDLPGYGYAQVSHAQQEQWRKNLENYLLKRDSIQRIIQLVDSRHPPQLSDRQMFDWIRHYQRAYLIIMTKTDKISKNDIQKRRMEIKTLYDIDSSEILPFSAEDGYGRDAIWDALVPKGKAREGNLEQKKE